MVQSVAGGSRLTHAAGLLRSEVNSTIWMSACHACQAKPAACQADAMAKSVAGESLIWCAAACYIHQLVPPAGCLSAMLARPCLLHAKQALHLKSMAGRQRF